MDQQAPKSDGSVRDRWRNYLQHISSDRKPGFIGKIPYLLWLRGLMIIAVLVRFYLPFSKRFGSRWEIVAAVLLLVLQLGLAIFLTRRFDSLSIRVFRSLLSGSLLLDIVLITWLLYLTATPTSDFYLFYYLPILAAAELLPLAFVAGTLLAVCAGFGLGVILLHFSTTESGVDSLILAGMRGGFLLSFTLVSALLIRLQRHQNVQNLYMQVLLDFRQRTAKLFHEEDILNLTADLAKETPDADYGGVFSPAPGAVNGGSVYLPEGLRQHEPKNLSLVLRAIQDRLKSFEESDSTQRVSVGDCHALFVPIRPFNTFHGVLFAVSRAGQHIPNEGENFLQSLVGAAGTDLARAKRIAIFRETSLDASRITMSEGLIDWLLQRVTDDYDFEFAAISAVDPDWKTISLVRDRNLPPGLIPRTNRVLEDSSRLSLALRTKKREVIVPPDSLSKEPNQNRQRSDLMRIVIPMLDGDKVVGVLEAGCPVSRQKQALASLADIEPTVKLLGGAVSAVQGYSFLAEIAERAMKSIGAESATIHLYDENGRVAQQAAAGRAAKHGFIVNFPPHPEGMGFRARKSGKSEKVDTREDVRTGYPQLYGLGVCAIAAFPLKPTEGVLYVHFFQPHTFTSVEIEIVETVVGFMEAVILNRQALDHVAFTAQWGWTVARQQSVIQLLVGDRDLNSVLRDLTQNLRWILGAFEIVLYVYEGSTQTLRYFGQMAEASPEEIQPGRDSLPSKVFSANETRFVEDVKAAAWDLESGLRLGERGIQSCAAVALRQERHSPPVGVMFVNYREKQSFPFEVREAIQKLGTATAIAIGTAHDHERANRTRTGWKHDLEALREIDGLIARSLDNPQRDAVLDLVLAHAVRITGAPDGVVYLLNSEQGTLAPLFVRGFKDSSVKDQKFGEGIVGWVAKEKRSFIVPNELKDERYVKLTESTRSELAVPLKDRDEVLGVIKLEHPDPRFFNEDHRNWLETLALQGVIAIRSVESFQALEAPIRAIGAVTGRIQRDNPDLLTALYFVLTGITAKQGLSFTRAMLFLVDPDSNTLVEGVGLGPIDGGEADGDWTSLENQEKNKTDMLEYLLDQAAQYQRELKTGDRPRILDGRVKSVVTKMALSEQTVPVDILRSGGAIVEHKAAHPVRQLIGRIGGEIDPDEELAFVPLDETAGRCIGILVVDRAYQRKAKRIQQVDLKNLNAFGELAAFAIKNEKLRGQLRDPHRQAEWEHFVVETMHDLRIDVGLARGIASNFRDECQKKPLIDGDAVSKFLANLRDRHANAMETIQRVARYAEPLVSFRKLDLLRLAGQVVAAEPGVSFQPPDGPVLMAGDPARMTEALRNLITNAREAAGDNSIERPWIEVQVGYSERSGQRVAYLEVRDNAGGIPPEYLENVLKRYYSSKGQGRGLGLPIVKKITEAHGGTLDIKSLESEFGKGTIVRLEFPALAADIFQDAKSASSRE